MVIYTAVTADYANFAVRHHPHLRISYILSSPLYSKTLTNYIHSYFFILCSFFIGFGTVLQVL